MAKWLLLLFTVQALGQVAELGDVVGEYQLLIGLFGWTPDRSVGTAFVLVQLWFTCYVVYCDWRKEREDRERLRR